MHKEELVKKIIETNKTHVYFMQIGNDGPIKIGITKRIKHRLAVIQVDNPSLIYLLAIFPGSRDEELSLHKQFKDYNIIGEWFEPCEELLDFIKQYEPLNLTSTDFQEKRKRGPESYNWKGDKASKSSKQQRARAYKRYKTSFCEKCNTGRGLDVHFIDGNKDNLNKENIAYYCRRCRMEIDGTLKSLHEFKREKLPPRPCKICGKLSQSLSHLRCHTCMEYFRRHGIERSEMKIEKTQPVNCIVCGKLVQQPAKGKCHTCYEFFRRNGFERLDEAKRDIEDEYIRKLQEMTGLMTFEKVTYIRELYASHLYTFKFIAKYANISADNCRKIIINEIFKDENYKYTPNTCSKKAVKETRAERILNQLDGYAQLSE